MKKKIFTQKLLAVGTLAALGLGVTTSAYAVPSSYAISSQETTNFSLLYTNSAGEDNFSTLTDISGTISSDDDCSTGLPNPDDSKGNGALFPFDFNTATFPPAFLNSIVSDCGIAGVENNFTPIGQVGDYGNGDAVVSNTTFAGEGAGSNIGEAFTSSEAYYGDSFRGRGSFKLSVTFTVNEPTSLVASFTSAWLIFAQIIDSGPGSGANATLDLNLTVGDITDDPANPVEVLRIEPPQVNDQANVAGPGSFIDGSSVKQSDSFSGDVDLLEGRTYKLEFTATESSIVTVTPPPPEVVVGDHYLCYKSFGHFLREQVNLVDQFDDVNFDVLKPKMFCNPAIKPERDQGPDGFPLPILNPDAHLLSYKIHEAHREPRHERKTVVMKDQFFDALELLTVNPDRLMVPSGKSLDGTIPADQTGSINHFKCYRVRPIAGFTQTPVNIADQFTDDINGLIDPAAANEEIVGKDFVLVRPTRMCTPVSKNGEEIIVNPDANPEDPRDHLMCYGVKPDLGARLNRKTEVTSNNQFRSEDLVLKRELEFCAPATKTVIISDQAAGTSPAGGPVVDDTPAGDGAVTPPVDETPATP